MDRKFRSIFVFVAVLSLLLLCGCRGGDKTETTTEPIEDTAVQDTTDGVSGDEWETPIDVEDGTTAPVNNEEVSSEGNSDSNSTNNGGSGNTGSTGNGSNNGGSSTVVNPTEGSSTTTPTEAATVDDSFFEGPIDVIDPDDVVEVTTSGNNASNEKPTVGNDPTESPSVNIPATEGSSVENPTQGSSNNVPTTEGNSSATEPDVTEPAPETTEAVEPEQTTQKPTSGAIQLPMIPG